ncbi:hypothetical protein GUJ93_ZPchr0010g9105 [Zizania palustris]|uniref:Uncharacterized protein n=1 Tax=Zizania palustris TaxID=103762 RepID=A0A8J5W8E7_ZIZPA|nr:hypothetical protein GUJ93_ZPchr0010g9105 [Zizania palustris]
MTADDSTPATARGDPRLAAAGGLTPRSDSRRPDVAHCHQIRPRLAADDEDGDDRNGPLRAMPVAAHPTAEDQPRRVAKLWQRRRWEGPDPVANDLRNGGDRATRDNDLHDGGDGHNNLHDGGDRATHDDNDLRDGSDGRNGLQGSMTAETRRPVTTVGDGGPRRNSTPRDGRDVTTTSGEVRRRGRAGPDLAAGW